MRTDFGHPWSIGTVVIPAVRGVFIIFKMMFVYVLVLQVFPLYDQVQVGRFFQSSSPIKQQGGVASRPAHRGAEHSAGRVHNWKPAGSAACPRNVRGQQSMHKRVFLRLYLCCVGQLPLGGAVDCVADFTGE